MLLCFACRDLFCSGRYSGWRGEGRGLWRPPNRRQDHQDKRGRPRGGSQPRGLRNAQISTRQGQQNISISLFISLSFFLPASWSLDVLMSCYLDVLMFRCPTRLPIFTQHCEQAVLHFERRVGGEQVPVFQHLDITLNRRPGKGIGISLVGRRDGPGVFVSALVIAMMNQLTAQCFFLHFHL